jgi:acyl-CoA thioester hydrolase
MAHIFAHPIEVRFRDCDSMGHVNNAVYLTYLEQARLTLWRRLWGFGPDASPGTPSAILARAEIDFRIAARFGDTLEVRISVAAIGNTSFTYDYEVVDGRERLMASGRTVQVMYDYAAAKPVPIPDLIRKKLQGI